jgi:type II secretory pathway pseudopilin PulG
MKTGNSEISRNRGTSLLETVIAMGVLAVAIPLVFGAIAESGQSSMSAEAETRSTWVIPACMDEIQASREGKPIYFTATTSGQAFPASGSIWALGFSSDGKPVGKIEKAVYDKGAKEISGKPIRYIATLSAVPQVPAATPPMMRVLITLEYPSTAPAAKRQKLDFYTRIP